MKLTTISGHGISVIMETRHKQLSKDEAFWRKAGRRQQLARLYDLWDELAPKRRSEWLAIGRTLVTLEKHNKQRERLRINRHVGNGGI